MSNSGGPNISSESAGGPGRYLGAEAHLLWRQAERPGAIQSG